MKHIVLSGATGLIGKKICKLLTEKDYIPVLLTRKKNSSIPYTQYLWDPNRYEIDQNAFDNCYAVIHLAGANVAGKRWTRAYKEEILKSRVQSAQLIIDTLHHKKQHIHAFISASAVGYYNTNTIKILTEQDEASAGFLGKTCVQWEATADAAHHISDRIVKLRIGIVLANEGGAFKEIYKPMKFRIAAIFGDGNQIYPWVHIDDVARMFVFALEKNIHGTFNAVAPQYNSFLDIIREIEKSTQRKTLYLPVPKFLLKLMLGEFAETLYASQKVSADKIVNVGYQFKYDTLQKAIASLT